jgi:ribonuclease HI
MAMRKVYQAVIIPQMLWGLSAWYCPAAKVLPRVEMKRVIRELAQIQKRAAILISGAFRGTAGAALDIELHLMPMELRLDQMVEEAAIRILTGPQWACPQNALIKRKRAEQRIGGMSPTEAIAWKTLKLELNETWEMKQAFVLAPWDKRITCIIENQEAAIKTHDNIHEQMTNDHLQTQMVFTDGSGFAGGIGAAMYAPLQPGEHRRYLGTEDQSTVYAGELNGIEMALAVARRENKARNITIFSDSQAAIQAVQDPQRPSGQYVLSLLYDHIKAIRALPNPPGITLRWIPAHVGVEGNETVDVEAKLAATFGMGEVLTEVPVVRLAAAARRAVRKRIGEKWARQWERERTSTPTKRLVIAPNKKIIRLYDSLSKPQCAILIQMRTMRIGLKHFLFKIKAADSDRCGCDAGSQTPRHVLMECPSYIGLRANLWDRLQDIEGLEMDYDKIMSHPQATRYVVNYMHQTGLLQQFRHVDLDNEDDDEPNG